MGKSLILGHRGWFACYPENTLLSIEKSLKLGIDGIEFDVQLTADGIPIVFHDQTLERTTNGSGSVCSFSYSELASLNAGKALAEVPDFGFQRIPTLQEVLDLGYRLNPSGFYNIELKVYAGNGHDLVNQIVPLVQQHPLGKQILFSSFHHDCLRYMKQQYPDSDIGLLFEDEVADPWRLANQFGAYSVNIDYRFAHARLVERCQRQNVRVVVWTVDDPKQISEFIQMGVDIIISNHPDVAINTRGAIYQ